MGSGSNRNSKPEVDADALAHDIRAALQPFGTSPAESTDPDKCRRDAHRTKPQSKEEPSHGSACRSPTANSVEQVLRHVALHTKCNGSQIRPDADEFRAPTKCRPSTARSRLKAS